MKRPLQVVLTSCLLAASVKAQATDLSFSITSPLKSAGVNACPSTSTDADADCLDDAMEEQLAAVVSPYYLWDEGEDCNWYSSVDTNTGSGESDGYFENIPRYYYQVRPIKKLGAPPGYPVQISKWSTTNPNAWYYWVRIHYFFNYPRDCGTPGHQGDNEGVYFDLYSTDLVNWGLGSSWFPRHTFGNVWVSGAFIHQVATEAGVIYPIVLADDKGHGSWEGISGGHDQCGSNSQGNWWELNYYCVTGDSIAHAIQLGNWVYPDTSRNIGEPTQGGSDGRWNGNVLLVETLGSTQYARSVETVQYGLPENSEYWSNVAGTSREIFNSFCGWECSSRRAENSCWNSVYDHTGCTGSSMWSKLEKAPFSRW